MASPGGIHPANSIRRFATYAWGVLAFHVTVILWGAYVRATGSGAGCGGHWPLCNGEVVPRGAQAATLIEYTHRLTSGLALIVVVLLAVFAFRIFPRGSGVRRAAILANVFTVTEALLGAALVLLGYVAHNTSTWRGVLLGTHLINTLLLLASVAVTAWLATGSSPVVRSDAAGIAEWSNKSRFTWRLAVVLVLLTGVTGAVAALGDTLFAAPTLRQGMAMDFSGSAHPFVRARVLHPFFAAALALCLLSFAAYPFFSGRAGRTPKRLAGLLLLLTGCQICMGVIDIVLQAPVWAQMLHLLGADAVIITFVLLSVELITGRRTVAAGHAENAATITAFR